MMGVEPEQAAEFMAERDVDVRLLVAIPEAALAREPWEAALEPLGQIPCINIYPTDKK